MGSAATPAPPEPEPANDAPVNAPASAEGAGAAGGAPPGSATSVPAPPVGAPAGPGSLGERQVQAKAAPGAPTVGDEGDEAEKAADDSADRVMRMKDPVGRPAETDVRQAPPASDPERSPSVAPAAVAAPGSPSDLVQRKEDEGRMPTAAPAPVPGSAGSGGAPGAGPRPDAVTPAGPAPMAAGAPGTAGDERAETGTPAPEPEPPAPEGRQPARGTPEVPPDVQEYLEASRGQGAPLPDRTRQVFEAKFGRPFDDVGIHDGAQADDAARKLDALAFTRGSDIYFRSGAYDPGSEAGERLLAHELAHVVQQRPGINREVRRKRATPGAPTPGGTIRRTKPPATSTDTASTGPKAKGTLTVFEIPKDLDPADTSAGTAAPKGKKPADPPAGRLDTTSDPPKLVLDTLYVPAFKKDTQKTPLRLNRAPRTDAHAENWRKAAGPKIATALGLEKAKDKDPPFAFQYGPISRARFYLGTGDEIGLALSTLPYDKTSPKAKPHDYEIDHIWEHQVGGPDTSDNLWLLDKSTNRGSGPAIQKSIERDVAEFLRLAGPKLAKPPDASKLDVTFSNAVAGPNPRQKSSAAVWAKTLTDNDWWKLEQLGQAMAVAPLELVETDAAKQKAFGTKERLAIYTKPGGGAVQNPKWNPATGTIDPIYTSRQFRITAATYTTAEPPPKGQPPGTRLGTVQVSFFDKLTKTLKPLTETFQITGMAGVRYGGLLDTAPIRDKVKQATSSPIQATPFSLVTFPDLDFDLSKGLVGRGLIPKPSIKLLEDVQFGVLLDGDDVGIEATIHGGALKLPGPFQVTGGSLGVKATTGGVAVEGRIDFEIEKLASGFIEAAASTKAGDPGFALAGELNFDTKMFTKATLGLSYRDGTWGVTGELAVGPDKIKGIKSASARVAVDDDKVSADGEFETSIKGVQKGKVGFRYDPAKGAEITGAIEFGQLPGIKSGKLDATVTQGATGWSLSGGVTMVSSVPGVDASISGSYADGAFDVYATVAYAKGLAKGSVGLGLTNAVVGADGKPTGPPQPDGALTAYGEGKVTLTLTPWLQGTVGLKLKPTGEIEVSGELALPASLEVFPEKKVEKKILDIGIDIPIVGVSAAGQRIGIFATVRGGVTVGAGFGPGLLKDVSATVTYNPDRPEDTTVTGRGTFYVPAGAGLRLNIDGGVGAGIPVVSATVGLTVYGELGLSGAASASAALEWSASRGVTLDAKGEITVQPKFKFGVDAFVDIKADVVIAEVELYHKTWKLAAFEYGSNLTFGMVFPIHYESGKPFELSYDQVQWKYPDINPSELLGGLVKQMVG